MVAASSIGPGAANMVTAAGVAMSNRLPVLFLAGDVFANRRPDPVLQQVEHFNNPTTTVNDAFRAVTRYWDRITHPEQIISALPQALAVMLDPADCGPAFLGLCQDTQELAFDYPESFFEPRVHHIRRQRPDKREITRAAELLRKARKPLVISGGGVRYSLAEGAIAEFASRHRLPVAETIAGRGAMAHGHPNNVGPIGVIGSASANTLAGEVDVVLAIGTRLQDFTTGSWSVFSPQAQFVSINAARFDATKHRAHTVVADAHEAIVELGLALDTWRADEAWTLRAQAEYAHWNDMVAAATKPTNTNVPSYAQVIGVANKVAGETDLALTAAGGFPGELCKNWQVKRPGTFDCEFGFSCMGYEISGAWGAKMADESRDVLCFIGDGSYLMMNSDIYSTVLTGHKLIVVLCDNGGFAVINRLQNFKGVPSFNNQIEDCRIVNKVDVDFSAHAASMGALTRKVESLTDLEDALRWAKTTDRTTVIVVKTDAYTWTPGDAWWDVGVPEVSPRETVKKARADHAEGRKRQRVGV
jgi:3D-(3,5/4)-trihydroxycyclohexane-1,2-dione acylhydrolase (decyclizing)